jgi:hypothetical protein
MSKKAAPKKVTARPVQQMTVDGEPVQLVDPSNGKVALVVHRGTPLPKEQNKDISEANLCFHRIVPKRDLWAPTGESKAKELEAANKAVYVRSVRLLDGDKKSVYRPLTKAQMRQLYGKEADETTLKLGKGIEVPMYDKSVRKFIAEEAEASAKRKKSKKESSDGDNSEESKAKKRARLKAQLAALDKE